MYNTLILQVDYVYLAEYTEFKIPKYLLKILTL